MERQPKNTASPEESQISNPLDEGQLPKMNVLDNYDDWTTSIASAGRRGSKNKTNGKKSANHRRQPVFKRGQGKINPY